MAGWQIHREWADVFLPFLLLGGSDGGSDFPIEIGPIRDFDPHRENIPKVFKTKKEYTPEKVTLAPEKIDFWKRRFLWGNHHFKGTPMFVFRGIHWSPVDGKPRQGPSWSWKPLKTYGWKPENTGPLWKRISRCIRTKGSIFVRGEPLFVCGCSNKQLEE